MNPPDLSDRPTFVKMAFLFSYNIAALVVLQDRLGSSAWISIKSEQSIVGDSWSKSSLGTINQLFLIEKLPFLLEIKKTWERLN